MGTILLSLFCSAAVYFIINGDIKQREKENLYLKRELAKLQTKIDAYDAYLVKRCGYETPLRDCGYESPLYRPEKTIPGDGWTSVGTALEWVPTSPVADMEYFELMNKCAQYESDNPGATALIEIDGATYDLRESKLNRLLAQQNILKRELLKLQLRTFLCEWIIIELEKEYGEVLDNTWEKISNNARITSAFPSHSDLLGAVFPNEVTDIGEIKSRAKKTKRELSEDYIKRKERFIRQEKAMVKLLEDFEQYVSHSNCSEKKCQNNSKKNICRDIRKRFRRHDVDLAMDLRFYKALDET